MAYSPTRLPNSLGGLPSGRCSPGGWGWNSAACIEEVTTPWPERRHCQQSKLRTIELKSSKRTNIQQWYSKRYQNGKFSCEAASSQREIELTPRSSFDTSEQHAERWASLERVFDRSITKFYREKTWGLIIRKSNETIFFTILRKTRQSCCFSALRSHV